MRKKKEKKRRQATWKVEQCKEPFGVIELEEDVNSSNVHEGICRFYTKDSLVEAIPREVIGCNGELQFIAIRQVQSLPRPGSPPI